MNVAIVFINVFKCIFFTKCYVNLSNILSVKIVNCYLKHPQKQAGDTLKYQHFPLANEIVNILSSIAPRKTSRLSSIAHFERYHFIVALVGRTMRIRIILWWGCYN